MIAFLEFARVRRAASSLGLAGLFVAAVLASPGAALAAGTAAEGAAAPALRGAYDVRGVRSVRIKATVGSLAVVASPRSDVAVNLDIRVPDDDPERAARVSRRLRLGATRKGDRLVIEVQGQARAAFDGAAVEGTIEIPQGLPVEVELSVGEVAVRGVDRDLKVGLGVGEVDVSLPRQSVREVRLDVGIGEACLHEGDRRVADHASILGTGLRWGGGTGQSAVTVRLGVGEADVRLD